MDTINQSGSTVLTTGIARVLSYLCEEEDGVCYKPNRAGVYHHLAYGHFGGTYSELSANAGVTLTVQSYGFAINVSEGFIFHYEPDKGASTEV